MIENLLFIGLPYAAIVVCLVGSIVRFRSSRFTYSAMSSQFLESRGLRWGSTPWHVGIVVILLAHAVVFLAPELWNSFMSVRAVMLAVEGTGYALSVACLIGLVVLILRRVVSPRVQSVTTTMDFVVLALLFAQVMVGFGVAAQHRWGSTWAAGTVVPYVWSIVMLRPDPSFVLEMPALVKAHIVLAWLLILVVPFSRLVHVFSIPLEYLFRAPQVVVWSNLRRAERAVSARVAESRRLFVTGAVASVTGATLLGIGVVDKLVRFFKGPELTPAEEAQLMEEKLARIKETVALRELELERLKAEQISVARLAELDATRGKYFVDYDMRPALAFLGKNGLPLLISAKCTHLGCTVMSEVNPEGKILCPCHISYFDIVTGEPDPGSPAKAPLAHLDWVLVDSSGKPVARTGEVPDSSVALESCTVFITRPRREVA
jgi:nitrate reductase gamma subunit